MRLSGKRIKFTSKTRRTQRIHEEHIKEFTMCNLRALCVLSGEKIKIIFVLSVSFVVKKQKIHHKDMKDTKKAQRNPKRYNGKNA